MGNCVSGPKGSFDAEVVEAKPGNFANGKPGKARKRAGQASSYASYSKQRSSTDPAAASSPSAHLASAHLPLAPTASPPRTAHHTRTGVDDSRAGASSAACGSAYGSSRALAASDSASASAGGSFASLHSSDLRKLAPAPSPPPLPPVSLSLSASAADTVAPSSLKQGPRGKAPGAADTATRAPPPTAAAPGAAAPAASPLHLTLLVAGGGGLGKSRWVGSMAERYGGEGGDEGGGGEEEGEGAGEAPRAGPAPLRAVRLMAPPGGPAVRVTLVDSPGHGGGPHAAPHLAMLLGWVAHAREGELRRREAGAGAGGADTAPRAALACLYFLSPRGPSPADAALMGALAAELPVLPVVARADSLSAAAAEGEEKDAGGGATASRAAIEAAAAALAAGWRAALAVLGPRGGRVAAALPLLAVGAGLAQRGPHGDDALLRHVLAAAAAAAPGAGLLEADAERSAAFATRYEACGRDTTALLAGAAGSYDELLAAAPALLGSAAAVAPSAAEPLAGAGEPAPAPAGPPGEAVHHERALQRRCDDGEERGGGEAEVEGQRGPGAARGAHPRHDGSPVALLPDAAPTAEAATAWAGSLPAHEHVAGGHEDAGHAAGEAEVEGGCVERHEYGRQRGAGGVREEESSLVVRHAEHGADAAVEEVAADGPEHGTGERKSNGGVGEGGLNGDSVHGEAAEREVVAAEEEEEEAQESGVRAVVQLSSCAGPAAAAAEEEAEAHKAAAKTAMLQAKAETLADSEAEEAAAAAGVMAEAEVAETAAAVRALVIREAVVEAAGAEQEAERAAAVHAVICRAAAAAVAAAEAEAEAEHTRPAAVQPLASLAAAAVIPAEAKANLAAALEDQEQEAEAVAEAEAEPLPGGAAVVRRALAAAAAGAEPARACAAAAGSKAADGLDDEGAEAVRRAVRRALAAAVAAAEAEEEAGVPGTAQYGAAPAAAAAPAPAATPFAGPRRSTFLGSYLASGVEMLYGRGSGWAPAAQCSPPTACARPYAAASAAGLCAAAAAAAGLLVVARGRWRG